MGRSVRGAPLSTFSSPPSPDDELRLLAIGDVHLGTRPGSLPADLDEWGANARGLTPESTLSTVVERAIEERVDAVLFAGDVVESTNARFEALRPLESAVRRLREAEIPVLAVVGNHDVEALPRLARMVEGLELLGEHGRWQTRVVEGKSGPAVEILGWSFPDKSVRESPIASLLRDPVPASRSGIPRIGLLHADLDASGGNYAPITRSELRASGADAWLLGHIHKPSLGEPVPSGSSGPSGYLGSLVGLDPSETGPHGPWLVSVAADGRVSARQLPIAPLRWERFDLVVGEDEGPEDLSDRLLGEADRIARRIHDEGCIPKVLGLRPRLVGRTRHFDALRRKIDGDDWRGRLNCSVGDSVVFIDRVLDGLELAHDLAELARGDDPPAVLARKLIALEGAGEERERLIQTTRQALKGFAEDVRWAPLQSQRDMADPLSDDAIADMLLRSGNAALGELLAQRAAPSGDAP
jgi:exonuclease SbcD